MARTKKPEVEEARRQRVAAAAEAALAEGSWRSVTLADVAARAGVSKGAVTYWFATKEALLLEALRRYHARYEAQLTQVALLEAPIRERLAGLIHVAFPSQEAVAADVRFQIELWSYAKEHPEVQAAVSEAYSRFRLACAALVQLGVDEGWVTAPDVEGLYRFIHALIDGVSLHVAFDPEADIAQTRARLLGLIEEWLRR
jgi:TetR/AcrR family transcriptional repressor of bet genes